MRCVCNILNQQKCYYSYSVTTIATPTVLWRPLDYYQYDYVLMRMLGVSLITAMMCYTCQQLVAIVIRVTTITITIISLIV